MNTQNFVTIAVADIIDQLAEVVDTVRASTAIDNKPWMRALDKAWDVILTVDAIEFDVEAHAWRVESESRPGVFHVANGVCGCEAFSNDRPCYHRAGARLIARALELHRAADFNALVTELVQDAHESGARWYGVAEGLAGARIRQDELAEVAREWDAGVAAQRAALGARIGRAQAAVMARAA